MGPTAAPPEPEGEPFTFDDPLWEIVGMIKDGPPDLSVNHDAYLAGAHVDPDEE